MPTKSELAQHRIDNIQETTTGPKGIILQGLLTGNVLVRGPVDAEIPHLPHVRYSQEIVPELTWLGRRALPILAPIARLVEMDSMTPGVSMAKVLENWRRVNKEKRQGSTEITVFKKQNSN